VVTKDVVDGGNSLLELSEGGINNAGEPLDQHCLQLVRSGARKLLCLRERVFRPLEVSTAHVELLGEPDQNSRPPRMVGRQAVGKLDKLVEKLRKLIHGGVELELPAKPCHAVNIPFLLELPKEVHCTGDYEWVAELIVIGNAEFQLELPT